MYKLFNISFNIKIYNFVLNTSNINSNLNNVRSFLKINKIFINTLSFGEFEKYLQLKLVFIL